MKTSSCDGNNGHLILTRAVRYLESKDKNSGWDTKAPTAINLLKFIKNSRLFQFFENSGGK
jgi:hypothetical protein